MRRTLVLVLWACFLVGLGRSGLLAQPYGLDSAKPIGAFLDGTLPTQRPGSTTEGEWRLVNAFPNLTFVDPIFLTFEPTTQRIVVIEHGGKVWAFNNNSGVTQSGRTLFLDITARTKESYSGGVKSLAFHPQYGQSGSPNRDYLYVSYRAVVPPGIRDQSEIEAYNRISRFTVSGGVATPSSEVVLIQQYDPHNWHDCGAIVFGNDGFLYIGFGDIGASNDSFNSSQLINSGFFSGVLRIDVDRVSSRSHPIRRQPRNHVTPPAGWPSSFSNTSSTNGYFIPNDNPWLDAGGGVLEEFYAIGLRSPYRLTIDRATGNIWVGDVGQEGREEVNLLRKGGNYQWAYKEGTIDGLHSRPAQVLGIETPPLFEYGRVTGNCVIGGYVYHGQQFAAELGGRYIFADNGSQAIFALNYIPGQAPVVDHFATGPNGNEFTGISSLGETAQGELYFLKLNGFKVPGATILKLETDTAPEMAPALLSGVGAFTNLATLAPREGLIPYDVNNALWSDGGLKRRWLAIPNDGLIDEPGERIAFSENSEWDFPIGTVFIKHFMFPTDERNPGVLRWLETRFLVRGIDGQFYGLTYRWRPDRSDADLLSTGLDEPINLTHADGTVEQFNWHYPSRTECLACHSYAARHVLGLNTHQLNRSYTYESTGRTDNELRTLNHLGFLEPPVLEADIPTFLASSPLSDVGASVEDRVRSYLDSNCSQCHRPGGVQAHFDTRLVTPLALQNIINGPVENTLGIEGARVVVPQDLSRSLLLERLNSLETCCAMPPLAKNRLDSQAIDLMSEWIEGLDPSTGGWTCPCRFWDDATVPGVPAASDTSAVELGLKFKTHANGYITGIRFYKGPGNSGQHWGSLWRGDGTLLATTLFSGETATGWQTASFSSPVPISAGTTYVASYHAPAGRYAVTLDYFATTGVVVPPLEAPASSAVGGNGVYRYGASAFPNQSYRAANYWVDVAFNDSSPDTTAPQVTSTSPSSGATNVDVAAMIRATFSESLTASTVTSSTFVLRNASGSVVAASVTYDSASSTANLDPSSSLQSGVTYTATLTGGSSGVKDLAGNPLAANFSWSFTTAAAPPPPPPPPPPTGVTIWSASTVPATVDSGDSSPYELGVKFRAQVNGEIRGVRFYKSAANGGAHTGSLWTTAGVRLATVSFTNESGSGWQQALFASPVPIQAGVIYVASYLCPQGRYSFSGNYFASGGFTANQLEAIGAPESPNGVYRPGATGGFPNQSFNSANYWVDVVFGAVASDTTPPQVTSTSPSSGATNVDVAAMIRATFSESLTASTVTSSTFVLRNASGSVVAASVTYDSASSTANLDPSSSLQSGVTYTATLTGGSSGVKDLAGNPLAANFSWSFTTAAAPPPPPPPPTGVTIWSASTVPGTVDWGDAGAYELGVKFRSSVSGKVKGVRFYKSSANTGTHVGHLWSATGSQLGSVTFTNETATGWQQALFATPISIQAGQIYIVSCHMPNGHYSANLGYFTSGGVTSGVLTAVGASESPNGVYRPGSSGFPSSTYNSTNYWVDLLFE